MVVWRGLCIRPHQLLLLLLQGCPGPSPTHAPGAEQQREPKVTHPPRGAKAFMKKAFSNNFLNSHTCFVCFLPGRQHCFGKGGGGGKKVSSFPESLKHFSTDRASRSCGQRQRECRAAACTGRREEPGPHPCSLRASTEGPWKDLGEQVPTNSFRPAVLERVCLSREGWLIQSVYSKDKAENGPDNQGPRRGLWGLPTPVTVHSDFGTQENKICHCFSFFPFYLP